MSPLLARNTSPASYTTQQHMYRYNFICGRRVLEELKHARVQYLHITYMCLYTTLMNGAESELNVLVTTCTICLSHEIAVNTDIIACGSVSHNACPTCMYIHRLTISCMSACSWENHKIVLTHPGIAEEGVEVSPGDEPQRWGGYEPLRKGRGQGGCGRGLLDDLFLLYLWRGRGHLLVSGWLCRERGRHTTCENDT